MVTRMFSMKIKSSMFLLFFALCLNGCADDVNQNVGLEYRFEITDRFDQPSQQFAAGEEIRMTLYATNEGNEVETLYFSDGQEVDFEVIAESAESLWSWSDGQVFLGALHQRDIPPHSEISAQVRLCAEDDADSHACPNLEQGEYTFRAWFLGTGRELESSVSID